MQLISPCDAIVVGALVIAINNILSSILVPTLVLHRKKGPYGQHPIRSIFGKAHSSCQAR